MREFGILHTVVAMTTKPSVLAKISPRKKVHSSKLDGSAAVAVASSAATRPLVRAATKEDISKITSLDDLFGDECVGAMRIEKIFTMYGDPKGEYLDIPWFNDKGEPNIVADPQNRPLQASTAREYEQRILATGLADDCAGGPLPLLTAMRVTATVI